MTDELFETEIASVEESFPVKIDGFEGPLDLLLYLIRKQEIDIYDIPIARVTAQYLEYVEMMKILNLEVAGEYLLMAATLIRIKARLLIPRQGEGEGEEDEEDPREELIIALLEYRKFKEASRELHKKELEERQVLLREDFSHISPNIDEQFTVDATLYDLVRAFAEIMKQAANQPSHEVENFHITIDEQVEYVLGVLQTIDSTTLGTLVKANQHRLYYVATFLALLELIKLQRIRVMQQENFGDIHVFRI